MFDITNQAINPLNALLGPKFTQLDLRTLNEKSQKISRFLNNGLYVLSEKELKKLMLSFKKRKTVKIRRISFKP
jgi:hypothetical protein